MRRLKAASLIETVVASALFMIVFMLSLDLLPALTACGGSNADRIAATAAAGSARLKYATGLWPAGRYAEQYAEVEAEVSITPYGGFDGVMVLKIHVAAEGYETETIELILCEEEL